MFLHTERQSLLRNICVATYAPTAALSTKCKECKLGGAGAWLRARRKGNGGDEPRLNSTRSTPVLFQLLSPPFEFAADLPVHTRFGQRAPHRRRRTKAACRGPRLRLRGTRWSRRRAARRLCTPQPASARFLDESCSGSRRSCPASPCEAVRLAREAPALRDRTRRRSESHRSRRREIPRWRPIGRRVFSPRSLSPR